MTSKAHILALIQSLPDDISYREIARQLPLVAGIREAQERIARGEGLTTEEILNELALWSSPERLAPPRKSK